MELLFKEIFDFGYIQTDPNYSNFLYDHKNNKIILLDFGASQKISIEVRNKFKNLLIIFLQKLLKDLIKKVLYPHII